jgi:hypothetical protein
VWSKIFIQYVVYKRMKCVYTQVAEGQIMYRVYVVCSRVSSICTRVSSKVNHVYMFLGRYKSIQAER